MQQNVELQREIEAFRSKLDYIVTFINEKLDQKKTTPATSSSVSMLQLAFENMQQTEMKLLELKLKSVSQQEENDLLKYLMEKSQNISSIEQMQLFAIIEQRLLEREIDLVRQELEITERKAVQLEQAFENSDETIKFHLESLKLKCDILRKHIITCSQRLDEVNKQNLIRLANESQILKNRNQQEESNIEKKNIELENELLQLRERYNELIEHANTLQSELNDARKQFHEREKVKKIRNFLKMLNDRSTIHEFLNLSKLLAFPGELTESTSIDFTFPNVEKPYESYIGINIKLRYFLRLTIIKRFSNNVFERDICVHQLSQYPEINNSIKMEVGIEDCLHIEFEYNKSKYHLKDAIVGKIYFLLVRIKIKHMEIAIIKKENAGTGPNIYAENETIAKYEIMDGAPVRGESIPIRLFLAGYELTPTMKDIQRKFSVRYFLNLVLVDEEERRYFKQQEIVLWRKQDKDKDKTKQSSKQYAHFQRPNTANQTEENESERNPTENLQVNEGLSSENNSDTPSD
ncbi:unnamed protein product [Rotaria sp. Silwood2]|nr:unnamed protein product [Rotaria sp. Silwood2]